MSFGTVCTNCGKEDTEPILGSKLSPFVIDNDEPTEVADVKHSPPVHGRTVPPGNCGKEDTKPILGSEVSPFVIDDNDDEPVEVANIKQSLLVHEINFPWENCRKEDTKPILGSELSPFVIDDYDNMLTNVANVKQSHHVHGRKAAPDNYYHKQESPFISRHKNFPKALGFDEQTGPRFTAPRLEDVVRDFLETDIMTSELARAIRRVSAELNGKRIQASGQRMFTEVGRASKRTKYSETATSTSGANKSHCDIDKTITRPECAELKGKSIPAGDPRIPIEVGQLCSETATATSGAGGGFTGEDYVEGLRIFNIQQKEDVKVMFEGNEQERQDRKRKMEDNVTAAQILIDGLARKIVNETPEEDHDDDKCCVDSTSSTTHRSS